MHYVQDTFPMSSCTFLNTYLQNKEETAMTANELTQQASEWIISHGLTILLIVIFMLVGIKVVRVLTNRFWGHFLKNKDTEFLKRGETLGSITRYILIIGIIALATVMIMDELGISIGPILATAGVMGLAVGFGAQHLVQDVISGFFILLEDQIRVGDVVKIAGQSGIVEKITLRMIILRDLAGNVHFVRNGNIDVVTNMTKEYSRYVFDIGVAYREDIDEVIEVIREVDEELRNDPEYSDDILEPIEILGLDEFGNSAIVIKARTKTKPIKQWRVGRAFNRLLKIRFDERNIEIPFPHITLYMGEDKKGTAPALNVNMEQHDVSA